MTTPVGAVVGYSLLEAERQAVAFVEGTMVGTVRVTRRSDPAGLNYTTGMVNDPEVIIYEGKARIGQASGANQMFLGDEQEYFANVIISIPLLTALVIIDDTALVLTGPDAHSLNRSYRVADVTDGGDLPTDQSFTCIGVARSRGNT